MTKKISDLMPETAGLGLSPLLIEVEFGVPSRQCVNYGICRIELARAPGRPRSSKCKRCGGLALASAPEEGVLELAFFQSSLSQAARRRYFGQGYFLMEEDFLLPRCLYNGRNFPAEAISCGRYRVLETEKALIVPFMNLIKSSHK